MFLKISDSAEKGLKKNVERCDIQMWVIPKRKHFENQGKEGGERKETKGKSVRRGRATEARQEKPISLNFPLNIIRVHVIMSCNLRGCLFRKCERELQLLRVDEFMEVPDGGRRVAVVRP